MATAAPIRNRIVGREDVDPTQLLANPFNFRVHTKFQEQQLATVLDEVGWVRTVLVNRTTGHVIDGHLRVEHAISRGERTVPVDYVDLTEQEEYVVLATHDLITQLAGRDEDKVRELLDANTERPDALALLYEHELDPRDILASVREANDRHRAHDIASGDIEPRFMVIVTCANEHDQRRVLDDCLARGLRVKAVTS